MPTVLIALFDRYEQAEAAVRDLELAGMGGGQVEVVGDVDRDARAEGLGFQPHEGLRERLTRAFRGLRMRGVDGGQGGEVHDDSGDMPNYIGEQEFYASHVKQEGAILIVRPPSQILAARAEATLKGHGSKTRDGKAGVLLVEEDARPRQRVAGSGT